ncbi:hypothetical protein ADL25_37265 [Streptomyces sp. NRRL F-5122]|nr:hypothetical protein ADL25_37265 [Streptomyces sp. NRRL F-5122]
MLVAKQMIHMPSALMILNWTPEYVRSLQRIAGMPFGQLSRKLPLSSATHAPSQTSPPVLAAGIQIDAEIFRMCWRMASVITMPTK